MVDSTSLELALDRLLWRKSVDDAIIKYAGLRDKIDEIWNTAGPPHKIANSLYDALGYLPGTRAPFMPQNPHAMTNALLGGLAGAGLGYGAASLAGRLLPEDWNKKRLRWLGVLGGAGLGAAPGLAMGMVNWGAGLPFNDAKMWQPGYNVAAADKLRQDFDHGQAAGKALAPELPAAGAGSAMLSSPLQKSAQTDGAGLSFDSQEFEDMIWRDPRIANRLDPAVQAGAAGLVSGAAALRGEPGGLVTPMDVARIAAGMGVGYTSGALVGGALGLLMGMPPKTQDKLKQTGYWAGAISQLVPIAFGGQL